MPSVQVVHEIIFFYFELVRSFLDKGTNNLQFVRFSVTLLLVSSAVPLMSSRHLSCGLSQSFFSYPWSPWMYYFVSPFVVLSYCVSTESPLDDLLNFNIIRSILLCDLEVLFKFASVGVSTMCLNWQWIFLKLI